MKIKILKSFNDPKLGLLKEGQEIKAQGSIVFTKTVEGWKAQ
jgi:hypothetical protein